MPDFTHRNGPHTALSLCDGEEASSKEGGYLWQLALNDRDQTVQNRSLRVRAPAHRSVDLLTCPAAWSGSGAPGHSLEDCAKHVCCDRRRRGGCLQEAWGVLRGVESAKHRKDLVSWGNHGCRYLSIYNGRAGWRAWPLSGRLHLGGASGA
jgi:hypothetical protein